MKRNYSISIYLDTRRAKKSVKYPLKLRVYTSNPSKQILYPTIFEFSVEEYTKILIEQKPLFKETRLKINALENKISDQYILPSKIFPLKN